MPEALSSAPLWISFELGIERTLAAATQVIVVGSDDDRFVGVRAFAFEHADDVLDLGRRAVDGGETVDLPTFDRRTLRLHVLIDGRFEFGERFAERRLEQPIGRPRSLSCTTGMLLSLPVPP